MGARREVVWAVGERYGAAGRREKGRILDELTATTGWHRKHAIRALSSVAASRTGRLQRCEETARTVNGAAQSPTGRRRKYAGARDALIALWEASDRVCGKRLVAMIPALLPALERHGRLQPTSEERGLLLSVSAATIDRMLIDVKMAAAGGRRRRVGFYSAIRREVPIRTFNDWGSPPPGFCEIDMVAHGGTSVAGSFIQTLTMVDIATGWTECLPLVARDGSLVVEAMTRAQSLFPWLIRGADFDNDSAFMNDVVVPWCREQKIEVTRSRAYKKNDQAFVEQKNGAVVRRLVGYGRFDGVETARVMARLYAAARLHVNFFQPSFKLKEKASRGRKGHQALSHASDAARACTGSPTAVQGHQAAAARDLSQSRSGGVAGRDPCGTGRARRADRQARSCSRGRPIAGRSAQVCAIARHDGQDRRGARHTSPAETALQETDTHALQARSASGDDRELAGGGAADHSTRHCAPARRDRSSHV
jgi:Integrase core domain